MKALADEMEAVDFPLVIKVLELDNIFAESEIGLFEAGDGNRALVHYPDAKDELAEMFVVFVREDAVEDTGSETIDIQKQFPCLVTA